MSSAGQQIVLCEFQSSRSAITFTKNPFDKLQETFEST